ncbi:hypothetical protein LCGC14_1012470 [marine sediment metagenome]|uniref:Uncharacterized protein n=1 Tax=marine sediment metagenome TaxID=412755 RepID=A0A0F9QI68_9ZZZZ
MSKIHLVTPSLCRQWGACYDDDKLHNLLGDGLTPLKVLALDIPVADRLWTVLRPELLTDCDLRLFGCWCATLALKAEQSAGHEPDDRSWAAVNVAEQFAYGRITKSEMAAAEADAWSAARPTGLPHGLPHGLPGLPPGPPAGLPAGLPGLPPGPPGLPRLFT